MFAESAPTITVSRTIQRLIIAQPETRAHKQERLALDRFARAQAQAFDARPRLVPRTWRTIPLAEFCSKVAACYYRQDKRQTGGLS